MPNILHFKVIIAQDEDGMFVATVPAIPGCYSQGKTYEEAVSRVREAIALCLEVAEKDSNYRAKLDLSSAESKNRFLGITDVQVTSL